LVKIVVMPPDVPSPPPEVPEAVVDTLADCSPGELRAVAAYAGRLAAHREDGDPPTTDGSGTDQAERPEAADDASPIDQPADVPSGATLTVKEINDNRYYYWQWRDGDQIRSQYARPVNPDR
jgi:hypothetical protein